MSGKVISFHSFFTACRQLFKKAQLLGYTTGQVLKCLVNRNHTRILIFVYSDRHSSCIFIAYLVVLPIMILTYSALSVSVIFLHLCLMHRPRVLWMFVGSGLFNQLSPASLSTITMVTMFNVVLSWYCLSPLGDVLLHWFLWYSCFSSTVLSCGISCQIAVPDWKRCRSARKSLSWITSDYSKRSNTWEKSIMRSANSPFWLVNLLIHQTYVAYLML